MSYVEGSGGVRGLGGAKGSGIEERQRWKESSREGMFFFDGTMLILSKAGTSSALIGCCSTCSSIVTEGTFIDGICW